ncbi:hypothetical protein BpHYR1_044683 [Brachionus plicatilis]|uniref:Uncharacterized protein n=1 Tax=Brachionus plicatilis TaxID=10195 RepID=A0A3M7PUQ7_BRAPC|nr:hypothetical protein BpHYR1_044683 [Brachionus plicatilis]
MSSHITLRILESLSFALCLPRKNIKMYSNCIHLMILSLDFDFKNLNLAIHLSGSQSYNFLPFQNIK